MSKEDYKSFNCSIGRTHKKGSFNWNKFKDNFTITKEEGKRWAKSLSWWINWRNWVIIGVIVSSVFAYGWYKGRLETPITIVGANELVGTFIPTDGGFVTFKDNGEIHIVDSDKKTILKKITAGDMPGFRKALKPIGIILEPIFVAGGSVGGRKNKGELGAGISFLKVWKTQLEVFITSYPAAYIGVSYSLTKNSGAGVGAGKGVDGSNRAILYYKWKF